jgi:hypothetical protein
MGYQYEVDLEYGYALVGMALCVAYVTGLFKFVLCPSARCRLPPRDEVVKDIDVEFNNKIFV